MFNETRKISPYYALVMPGHIAPEHEREYRGNMSPPFNVKTKQQIAVAREFWSAMGFYKWYLTSEFSVRIQGMD